MTSAIHDDPPLGVCVNVLAAAFAEQPTVVRLCGKDPRRRAAWFDALLRTQAAVPGRRLLATRDGRPVGVAVATAPGGPQTVAAQLLGIGHTLRSCGPRALVGTLVYLRRTESWKPADAWALEFVGVLPSARWGFGVFVRIALAGMSVVGMTRPAPSSEEYRP